MEQNRNQYQRIRSAAELRRRKAGQDNATPAERLIAQATVCGLILALLLFVRCINIPFTDQLRGDIKETLAVGADLNGLAGLSEGIRDSFESVKTMVVGDSNKNSEAPDDLAEEAVTPADDFNEDITENPEENFGNVGNEAALDSDAAVSEPETPYIDDNPEIRIDEDVLSDIESREDFYLLK